MRINFRQGLVSYTVDGTGAPQFLLPGQGNGQALTTVTLSVSPSPVTATFAHGISNYLQTFDTTVLNAWGPLPTDIPAYLYWDIDLLTGNVTYGYTILEPVVSSTQPANPENGQMWFDLSNTKMKVWNGAANAWVERARVLAGIVEGNNITQKQIGSQVGLTGDFVAGYIMYDSQLRPLRTSLNELLTTDTAIRIKTTVGTSGVLATPPNAFIPVKAAENIPAMSLVYFIADDQVALASSNPAFINERAPVGIIQESLAATEIGTLTQSGVLTYDQWDWSGHIGKAVYGDTTGQLTTIRPGGVLCFRVGTIKNKNTVLFAIDAETSPTVYTPSANDVLITGNLPITTDDVINDLGERVVSISLIPATSTTAGGMSAEDKALLDSYSVRFVTDEALIANKSDISHTHVESDIIGLIDDLNNKVNVGDYAQFDLRYALVDHNHDGRYALLVHTHEIADVLGLQDILNTKSDIGHLNKIGEIFTDVTRAPNTPDIGVAPSLTDILGTFVTEAELTAMQATLEAEIVLKAERTHLNAISEIYTSVDRTGAEDIGTAPSLSDVLGTFVTEADLLSYITFSVTDETSSPTAGLSKITFRAPYGITLTQIPRMSLSTSGSTSSAVDIKLAGMSILGPNKLRVDASEKTSTTATTPTTLAITAIPDDSEITIDLITVGDGATGVKVTLYFRKT